MNSVTATSRKQTAASTCTGERCNVSWRSAHLAKGLPGLVWNAGRRVDLTMNALGRHPRKAQGNRLPAGCAQSFAFARADDFRAIAIRDDQPGVGGQHAARKVAVDGK